MAVDGAHINKTPQDVPYSLPNTFERRKLFSRLESVSDLGIKTTGKSRIHKSFPTFQLV